MRTISAIFAVALCAAAANAAELNAVKASDVNALGIAVPAPAAPQQSADVKCGHVSGEITQLHLLAQPARSMLYTFPKTEAQFAEFVNMWTPILEKFGMKVTGTEYKADSLSTLKYESPDGRVIREFMGEGLNYNAKDPAEVKKVQHELLEPLEKAGMTPVAAFLVNNEIFRPTFNIYYLTKPEENQDKEVQLRQLKNGDDIDFDLLAGAVNLVRKDASYSMVYIGRLVGFKSKLAADEAAANLKLAEYKKYLAENKKDFIAAKIGKLDKPFTIGTSVYNYYWNAYFFQ